MFGFVSFRSRAQVLLVAAGACSFSIAAHAQLQAGYAVGEGENTSSVIIDFGFTGGDAYLFEYRYDGSATGEDLLRALDQAGDLDIDASVFDFGPPEAPDPQYFVNGFAFDGNDSVPDFNTSGSFWTYLLAEEPVANPAVYTDSATGPTGRVLSDGSLDGWVVNISSFAPPELGLTPTSNVPTSFSSAEIAQVSGTLEVFPVPEPSSAMLLALAGAAVFRRRRG